MARMKIVLTEDVEKVGTMGEIVSVAGGFARNFLIPRGLAVPATKGTLRQAEELQRQAEERAAQARAEATALQRKLEASPIRVPVQAGPEGQLFGSVTSPHIAATIEQELGLVVDRKDILLEEPIRHLGVHDVEIQLHPDVLAKVQVEAVGA